MTGAKPDEEACGQCLYWRALRCRRHSEWIVVSPLHPKCEHFERRAENI